MSNLFKFINLSDRSNNISEDDDSKLNVEASHELANKQFF